MPNDLGINQEAQDKSNEIIQYLPQLLERSTTVDEVAEACAVDVPEIVYTLADFLVKINTADGDKAMKVLVEQLTEETRNRFLVMNFRNAKRYGVLWQNVLDNTESINAMVKSAIANFAVSLGTDNAPTLKDLKALMSLQKEMKNLVEGMMGSPMAKLAITPAINLNQTFNGALGGGFVSPPDVEV